MRRGPEGGPSQADIEQEQTPDRESEENEISIHGQILQRLDEFSRKAARTTSCGGVEISGRKHEGFTTDVSFVVRDGKIVDDIERDTAVSFKDGKADGEMYSVLFEESGPDLTILEITKSLGVNRSERVFSQAEIDRGFDDMYQEIDKLGTIESSSGTFSGRELIGIIRRVRKGDLGINYVPRANDYRKKVWDLLKREKGE